MVASLTSAITNLIIQQPSTVRDARPSHQQKDCDSLKAQMIVFFSDDVFLIKVCTVHFLEIMLLHTS